VNAGMTEGKKNTITTSFRVWLRKEYKIPAYAGMTEGSAGEV